MDLRTGSRGPERWSLVMVRHADEHRRTQSRCELVGVHSTRMAVRRRYAPTTCAWRAMYELCGIDCTRAFCLAFSSRERPRTLVLCGRPMGGASSGRDSGTQDLASECVASVHCRDHCRLVGSPRQYRIISVCPIVGVSGANPLVGCFLCCSIGDLVARRRSPITTQHAIRRGRGAWPPAGSAVDT